MNLKCLFLSAAALSALVSLGGCDAKGAGGLVGLWSFSEERSTAVLTGRLRAQPGPRNESNGTRAEQDVATAMGVLAKQMSKVTITFNADKSYSTTNREGVASAGEWTIDERMGGVTMTGANGKSDTARISGDDLIFERNGVPSMVFARRPGPA